MLRTFALLLAPLLTVGLIYSFGWWTLLVTVTLVACTFVFSMRKGTDEDLARSGAGQTSFGTPTTFMAQLK
ncbi:MULTISPECIES: hypothetical protein [unclassified Variovorax]|uniref:hypothetical protein n=1 Tax=unclassified Variovorax TaxID=663243 RepID=UPI001BD6C51C|nr:MULTISPECIES: hypothetical protein [unclassified Variovorax]